MESPTADELLQEAATSVLEYADSLLKKDLNGSGQKLYNMWGKTTRKECFMFNYQNENFRAAYARNRFLVSGRCFIGAFARICRENTIMKDFLTSKSDGLSRVVSVGCGPGPDAAALSAYLRSRQLGQRLVYYCVDQCPEWAVYLQKLDAFLSRHRRLSLWFKPLRVFDMESVSLLPDADMIIFSFANTALMDPRIWPEILQRFKMVFILDSIRETLKDEYTDHGFQKFELPNDRTCCYYYFRGMNGGANTNVLTSSEVTLAPAADTGVTSLAHLSLRPGGSSGGAFARRSRFCSDSGITSSNKGSTDTGSDSSPSSPAAK